MFLLPATALYGLLYSLAPNATEYLADTTFVVAMTVREIELGSYIYAHHSSDLLSFSNMLSLPSVIRSPHSINPTIILVCLSMVLAVVYLARTTWYYFVALVLFGPASYVLCSRLMSNFSQFEEEHSVHLGVEHDVAENTRQSAADQKQRGALDATSKLGMEYGSSGNGTTVKGTRRGRRGRKNKGNRNGNETGGVQK